jgi:sulfoxide reductase heme-binding subunit YedZ
VNAVELELGLVRTTGWIAAVLLILAIAPNKRQRTFGLGSLTFAVVHLTIGLATPLVADVILLIYEPHLRAGATALLVLFFLGATSFPRLVKRAGIKQWKPLHRAVYLAALLVLHHALLSPHLPRWGAVLLISSVGMLIARRALIFVRELSARRPEALR